MFDWLYEGQLAVYLTLAGLAVVAGAFWARQGFTLSRQKGQRMNLAPWCLGALLVLALGYFLADRLVETRREVHVTPRGTQQPFTWVAARLG